MTLPTVFLFSGQGSQYFQMGSALYENGGVFKQCMDRMDSIVGDLTGRSIVGSLYGGRSKIDVFDDIQLTHPAIFMVEFALARTLIEAGIEPVLTLGASMGSFAAATIAGYINMEEALQLVIRQADIVQAHCPRGGMIAILADPKLFESEILRKHSVVAGHNFSSHFVVSAQLEYLPEIEKFLKSQNTVYQRLPVLYPFHSPWIEPAKALFLAAGQSLTSQSAQIQMVCCAATHRLETLPSDYFWQIARQPVLFQKTVALLEEDGSYQYLDLGPSGTLATFLKYLLPKTSNSRALPMMTPYRNDLKNLAAVIGGDI